MKSTKVLIHHTLAGLMMIVMLRNYLFVNLLAKVSLIFYHSLSWHYVISLSNLNKVIVQLHWGKQHLSRKYAIIND